MMIWIFERRNTTHKRSGLELATHHALNHSNRIKSEKDMKLELEASLESFFKIFEANY